jgi:membrane fusion protein, multidrug efflux system
MTTIKASKQSLRSADGAENGGRLACALKNVMQSLARALGCVAIGLLGCGINPAISDETSGYQDRARKLPIRGVVRPLAQAVISTDIVATVSTVGFQEGQAFKKGDVLVAFDCRRQEAELAATVAQLKEMQINVDTNAFLEKRDAANKQDLEISRARAAKAAADVDSLKARIDQCIIEAPFDGRVADLNIRAYEMPASGRPMIRILAAGELEIDLILPSNWLAWLKPGAEFKFLIDETRQSYDQSDDQSDRAFHSPFDRRSARHERLCAFCARRRLGAKA